MNGKRIRLRHRRSRTKRQMTKVKFYGDQKIQQLAIFMNHPTQFLISLDMAGCGYFHLMHELNKKHLNL